MEENKKRYIMATYQIQRAMETLCLYSSDERVEEYLRKLEDLAEYYALEEENLIKKGEME